MTWGEPVATSNQNRRLQRWSVRWVRRCTGYLFLAAWSSRMRVLVSNVVAASRVFFHRSLASMCSDAGILDDAIWRLWRLNFELSKDDALGARSM